MLRILKSVYCLLLMLQQTATETTTVATNEHRVALIESVRCRVRCIKNLQSKIQKEQGIDKIPSLSECHQQEECQECLLPCTQPSLSTTFCEGSCNNQNSNPTSTKACIESCQFLKHAKTFKSGRCPPEREVGVAGCHRECEVDSECSGVLKCCSTGCGWACLQATNMFDGFPDIPSPPEIKERRRGISSLASSSSSTSPSSSVELRWNSVSKKNASDCIMYVVEVRWSVGPDLDESLMTAWSQSTQTTSTWTTVEVLPGHWYQYRCTSVDNYGSRGPSAPSKAFTLSIEPKRPGGVENLTDTEARIHGDRVAVTISWSPPLNSDLPVSRYKIFWSHRPRSRQGSSGRESKQVVSGDVTTFILPNLHPSSNYLVHVQAICQYGMLKLKSSKVPLYIKTYPISPDSDKPENHHHHHRHTSPLSNLKVSSAVFIDGNLTANVSWTASAVVAVIKVQWFAEACIADHSNDVGGLSHSRTASTKRSQLMIHDLKFGCKYVVKIQAFRRHKEISRQGKSGRKIKEVGNLKQLMFKTPACNDVEVIGSVKPECPHDDTWTSEAPLQIHHTFHIENNSINVTLSWNQNKYHYHHHPQSSQRSFNHHATKHSSVQSDKPLPPPPFSSKPLGSTIPLATGYRITWVEKGREANTQSQTKVLKADETSLTINGLREGVSYLVKLQALYGFKPGPPSTLHFTSPLLPHKNSWDANSKVYNEESRQPKHKQQRHQQHQQAKLDWQETSVWKQRGSNYRNHSYLNLIHPLLLFVIVLLNTS